MSELSIKSANAVEQTNTSSAGYLVFEVVLSEASAQPVSVNWRAKPGTANAADLSDLNSANGTLTFAAGQTSALISVRINSDTTDEVDESIVLELSGVRGATLAGGVDRLTTVGTILDDDGTGLNRALLVSDVELLEGDSGSREAVFTVRLSRPSNTALTFTYQTVDGSATAGQDYTGATGTLTFAAGQTEAVVRVNVAGDTLVEAEESFALIVRPQAGSASAIASGIEGATGQALIQDDDAGAVVLSVRSASAVEQTNTSSSGYLVFEVVLSEASSQAVSVNWRAKPGTANAADLADLNSANGTLTMAAGQTSALIYVRINSDTADEVDESIVLELSDVRGATLAGGVDRLSTVGTILDDDGTGLNRALLVSDVELVEGDSGSREAVFTVRLSRPSDTALTFTYQTVDGSATGGQDYTAATGTLTFAAGQTEAVVRVSVNGDTLVEAEESFALIVRPQAGSAPAIASGIEGATGRAWIQDDDAGAVVLSMRSASAVEQTNTSSSGYLVFEVVLSEASSQAVSVNWRAKPGTANAADLADLNSANGTLTMAAGQTSALIYVRINSDTADEVDESIVLELSGVRGATLAGGVDRLTTVGTILDDDGTGLNRALLVSDVELVEGDSGSREAVFTVRLSSPAATALTFTYQTVDGSAQAGQDYTAATGTLTFAAGQTEAVVRVNVAGDTSVEAEESFALIVRPQAGSAAAIASGIEGATGQALIQDDDAGAVVLSVRSASAVEQTNTSSSGYLVFEVVLSEASAQPVSVNWRAKPGTANVADLADLNSANGTLTMAAGQTSALIYVRINSDTADEVDESIVLELSGVRGATLAGGVDRLTTVGTILDDDGTGLNLALLVSDVELVEGDSGSREAVFTVRLSSPAATALTFTYQTVDGSAQAGQDYTAATGTLTFAAGQTEAVVRVNVAGDTLVEAEESFALIVRPQAGSASAIASGIEGATGQAWIQDDDTGAIVLSVRSASAVEQTNTSSSGYLVFEVVLSEASSQAVSVNWRAKPGTANAADLSDLNSANGTLTIAAGQTSALIYVRINSDTADEVDESILLELSGITGATLAGGVDRLSTVGTILDDDGTGLDRALLVSDVELVEGDNGSQQAVFTVRLSRPSDTALTFTYQTVDGSATAGQDYTAATGTLTFAAGQTEAVVRINVSGDTVIEAEESFALIVRPQAGSASAIASGIEGATGQALIQDDDAGSIVLSVRSASAVEQTNTSSNGYLVFEVVLSEASSQAVSVNWRSKPGTANAADLSDLNSANGTLTIAAGQTSALIYVRINSDNTDEVDESILLELSGVAGAQFAGNAPVLLTTGIILDDDGTGSNQALLVRDVVVRENDEGTRDAVFVVQLSRPADTALTFSYQTANGTAVAGQDYTATSGTLTFAAGQTEAVVRVPVTGDYQAEADETFVLSFAPNALVANGAQAIEGVATIVSDDLQDAPNAAPDTYTLRAGSVLTVAPGTGLLANDSDPEGDAFTAVLLSAPARGTVTLSANGAFSYTPEAGFTGTDSFQYRAYDGIGYSQPTRVTLTVTAAPASLSLDAGANTTLNEGGTFTRTINFIDGEDAGQAGWTYSIDYGDGSPVVTGTTLTRSLNLSHLYADGSAARTATVTVTDAAGESVTDSFTVNVANVAPAIALSGAATVVQGSPYVLDLGSVNDPGQDTVTEYRIDWGDGSPLQVIRAADLPAGRQVQHQFATAGQNTVRVTLVDEDGVHSNAGSRAVTVDRQPAFTTVLTLPDSLAPGEEGLATLHYANALPRDQAGVLVFIQSEAGLLLDPLTGEYRDSLLLIGHGDGIGLLEQGEDGMLEFMVRMANAPNSQASISVSIVQPDDDLDLTAMGAALRPEFSTDAVWDRVYANFLAAIDDSTDGLIAVLAENGAFLSGLGADGSSALAAWAFELEQAGDFGSLAERMAPGSLGDGWAFIGDIKLDIGANGDVAWRGLADLEALLSLDAATAAQYTVSASVGVSVALNGAVSSGDTIDRPVFTQLIDGSFATSPGFDGELRHTASGYEVRTSSGVLLEFDAAGKLQRLASATGRETTVLHDSAGHISGFNQNGGNTLTIVRDAGGKPNALADEYGNTTALVYGSDGKLASASDPTGTVGFGYTSGGDLSTVTPPGGPQTALAYDSLGRLVAIEVADTQRASIAYDSLGSYTWTSAEGQTVAVELAPGGIATQVDIGGTTTHELVYNVSGKLIGAQLADGSTVAFDIDAQGRLLAVTDPNGATVHYSYDGDSVRPASFTDAGGTTRSFNYDANGHMVQATWADGSTLQFEYDAAGQLASFTNRRGDASTYDYDASGRLIARTDAGGNATYAYDTLGRLTAATTVAGTTEIGYDSAGRVTHIAYPDGRSLDYGYDAAGRRTAMTDQDGNVQGYTYDAAGLLSTVSSNSTQIVAYRYDGDGRLVEEANGNGTLTHYSYDARGLLVAIVNLAPDGAESSAYRYSYDAAGQRISAQTPQGDWTYGYDATGQLTGGEFNANAAGQAAGLADKSLTYHYDAAGNRTSIVEDGITTTYTSNALNQYTQIGGTSYTYDTSGNQVSKTVGSDTWTYAYNADNRLVQAAAPQGTVTQYEYDVFGNRSAVVENGARTEFLVDPFALGLGSAVAEYSGGLEVARYFYGLNAIAQRTGGANYFYEGDAVGSVTAVTAANGAQANTYAYDPYGQEMLERETLANRLEFNGLFGVEEADAGVNFMRARFYDASQGRFTSEDPLWLSGDTTNLYRFALNDPTADVDPSGEISLRSAADKVASTVATAAGVVAAVATAVGFTAVAAVGAVAAAAYAVPVLISKVIARKIEHDAFLDLVKASGGATTNLTYQEYQKNFDLAVDINGSINPRAIPFPTPTTVNTANISAQSTAKAATTTDPHLRTFDNLSYDFQAAGEFVLARGSSLEIQVRQQPWGTNTNAAVNTAVAMRLGDAVVGLYKDAPDPLNINGQFVQIADGETVSVGGGSIYRNGTTYVITNAVGDGASIQMRGTFINVHAFIHDGRGSDVEGLLGNHDGQANNDLTMANGTVVPHPVPVSVLYGAYADSWRVTDETTLFIYGAGESTATYTNRNFPTGIVTLDDLDPAVRTAAEKIAREAGLVDGTWEFDNAVLDIALTGLREFAESAAEGPRNDQELTPIQLQHAPVLVTDTADTPEDTTIVIDVLANDTDPEGDPLQVVAASDPNGGTVAVLQNGQLRFTPATDFHGVTTLRYTVSDGAGNLVEGTVEVTVEAVNDAPEPASDAYEISLGQTLTVGAQTGVLANDADVDGDALTVVSHGMAANGTLQIDADGAFRYTPNAGFVGTEVVEYTVSDGTASTIASLRISVGNTAPALTLSAPGEANEGDSFVLSIEAEDAEGGALSYSIDWGDGTQPQTLTGAELAAAAGLVTHVFTDDAQRTVSVTATDNGGATTTRTHSLTVNNVAPTIALSGAASVQAGQVYSLNLGAITDPGTDTVSQYIINWGDGSQPQTVTSAGNVAHTYASAASRTISVTLVDEDGSFANPQTVQVNVTAPTATLSLEAGANASVAEGSLFTRTINFSDGQDNGAAGWTYSIDYGDGTAAVTGTTGATALNLSHLYAEGSAARTVTVTVTDVAGETVTDSFVVTVDNVAPTATVGGNATVAEGSVFTLSVGTVSDPGVDTRTGYSIDWGDGSAVQNFTPAQWTAASGSFTHVYADGASGGTARTVTVRATDEDGTFTLGTHSLTVANAAPTVTLGGAAATNEGATYTLAVAATDPAGANDTLSYTIDWGDGSAVQTLTAVQLAAVAGNVTHVFADDENGLVNATARIITVTANDGEGGVTSQTRAVTVNNVAPTIALSGAASVQAGQAYTLNLGAITDPGTDTVSQYIINWGDGSQPQTVTSAGNVAHTYASVANRTISVTLVDEDGSFANPQTVQVNVTAPTATLSLEAGANASVAEGSLFTRTINFSDGQDNGAAGWTYSIDYGDGSAAVTGTATSTQLNLSHVFADGSATRNVTVTLTDVAGESVSDSFQVAVANVAPTVAFTGLGTAQANQAYTLSLGTVTDPGADTLTGFRIDWGDGSALSQVGTRGDVQHVYATAGRYAVQVYVMDEDGSFLSPNSLLVDVAGSTDTRTVRIGDSVERQRITGQWASDWSADGVAISHTADASAAQVAWSAVRFDASLPTTLAGGDIYNGDLGVSGFSAASSTVRQEIDGLEALRFAVEGSATSVTLSLSRLFTNDDGTGLHEAGRARLYDATGALVGEQLFQATNAQGTLELDITSALAFSSVELSAGTTVNGTFQHGAYANPATGNGSASFANGTGLHGSDFLVNWAEFEVVVVGQPPQPA